MVHLVKYAKFVRCVVVCRIADVIVEFGDWVQWLPVVKMPSILRDSEKRIGENQNGHVLKKLRLSRSLVYSCHYEGCLKVYSRPCLLEEHFRSHTRERPYRCSVADCEKRFLREGHLKEHFLSHNSTNDRPHKCTYNGCELHEKVHAKKPAFICNGYTPCKAEFRKHTALRKHVSSEHTHVKPFPCPVESCDKHFNTRAKLKSHDDRIHSNLARYFCSIEGCECSTKGFTKWTDLQKHVKSIHAPICVTCGKECGSSSQLTAHMKTHSFSLEEIRTYRCTIDECDWRFTRSRALKIHTAIIHEGLRPFPCTVAECGMAFSYKKALHSATMSFV